MNFYTAAVEETRWKERLSKEDGRIGSNTMEAFALLVLVNNCKAWLYKEKKTHQSNDLTKIIAVCWVMQNKFTGMLHNRGVVFKKGKIVSHDHKCNCPRQRV
jgi:hypothetical protein